VERPGTQNLHRYADVVTAAGDREETLRGCSVTELAEAAARLRPEPDLGTGRQSAKGTDRTFPRGDLAELCALGREAARRALGERAFDVQLLGAVGLLTGHVVEMATGEGKTLAGAIAAAGFALRGRRVHVVSINDYLARRDAEWMGAVYDLLGVSVGWLDQHSDWSSRHKAYECDVTYVSVSELGFDVLRDRLRTDPADIVLPTPDVVIVDEADSVMVDEATVPLVLAGTVERTQADARVAAVVRTLLPEAHYEVDAEGRNVSLTDAGLDRVERRLGRVNLYSGQHLELLIQVNLALQARALLHRDVDYLVRDGKVELINVARGRVARLQRWPDGLQAAVEAKERLTPSPSGEVLDSMIVQELIGRYRTVCGMSGTAVAVADQLAEFYRLKTGPIPTNVPCVRDDQPDRLYATAEQKQTALVEYVRTVHDTGRPILIGTRSVAESEQLAEQLADADIPGVVLNAKNDAEEAAIIARAGEHGRVTISTQMAGRGTDIRLGDTVAELGGLCVVGSGRYHTGRLDDQLRGRAGRQGDPGSSILFTSLDDDLVTQYVPNANAPAEPEPDGLVLDSGAQELVKHAQRVAEGAHLELHRNTWRYHQLLAIQRDTVLTHRDQVLNGDAGLRRLRELCPDRHAELRDTVPDTALDRAARLIVLYHLDHGWTEHLAYLADIREGIHLRALSRQTPIDEFHRIAIAEFAELLPTTYRRAAETFTEAPITAEGVDLDALGLKRPTSTWTYLVSDNPFGSDGQRTLDYVAGLGRKKPSGRRVNPAN
jgi:preprotein translocase subunit SecA